MVESNGVAEKDDERYMRLALEEAEAAAAEGEVPIGAVVVCDGRVVARAHNRRENDADPSAHAEFTAMVAAARELGRGTSAWDALDPTPSDTYAWDAGSTYVRRPTFLDIDGAGTSFSLDGARVLAYLGDFVTTDHISPAGAIAPASPAA